MLLRVAPESTSLTGILAPLTFDAPFKRAFGSPGTLRSLLNSFMRPTRDEMVASIEGVEVKSSRHSLIYDILCRLESGDKVSIQLHKAEMRNEIMDRLMGYMSFNYAGQWRQTRRTEIASVYEQRFGAQVPGISVEGPPLLSYSLLPVQVLALLNFKLEDSVADCGDLIQKYSLKPAPGTRAAPSIARLGQFLDVTIVQLPLAPVGTALAEADDAGKWAHLLHYSHHYSIDHLPAPLQAAPFQQVAKSVCYEMLSKEELLDVANYQLNLSEDRLREQERKQR